MRTANFNLKAYSALACVFLLQSKVQAGIIYTDIEPDIILDSDFEFGYVDMDNNGVTDFAFLNFSYEGYNPWYSFIEKIFVGPASPLNDVAATFNFFYYFPYALSNGAIINGDLSFQNYGFQEMAWHKFLSLETFSGEILTWTDSGGEWFPEKLDHYLGVHFIDENADYHYGWIRCDVKDEGRTLVIKDYAYEKFIDHEIIAGDTIGYQPFFHDTLVLNHGTDISSISNEATIYSFENTIYIQLQSLQPNTTVKVYDLTGKEIYNAALYSITSTIPLNAAKGIYIVSITNEESILTKKVYLDQR